MLISIEAYRTCDFPEGGSGHLDPRMRIIDPLASSVKPIRRLVFSCNGSFSIARATIDTSKHDEVHNSGYFILYGTLNGISMH